MVDTVYSAPIERIEKIGNKIPKISPTDMPSNDRLKQSMDFADKHRTVLERVRSILRCDKYSRKSYLWLLLMYYVKCNMIQIIVPLEDFNKATSPESINRCRRELLRKAKKGDPSLSWLLSDTEFLEEMDKMEELFHDYYANQKISEKARVLK